MASDSSWNLYTIGDIIAWDFVIDNNKMETFQQISGDNHPLHLNDDFAKSRGFAKRVVYGVLLASQVSRLIGEEAKDKNLMLTGFEINYHNPAYIGDQLKFEAKLISKIDSVQMLEYKFRVTNGDITLCGGLAKAVWRR